MKVPGNFNSNTQKRDEPPIGGADLECMLSCEHLGKNRLGNLIRLCSQYGFELTEKDSLLIYGEDPIVPTLIANSNGVLAFTKRVEEANAKHCILNFFGKLYDTQTTLSLILDFDNAILVSSVPEYFLWAFSTNSDSADFQRLLSFGNLCREMALHISAKFGYLGTEHYHRDEMQLDNAKRLGMAQVDFSFFSESQLKELFNWYLSVYTKRWSQ